MKKTVSVLLVIIMALSAVVSCGKTTETATATKNVTETKESSPDTSVSEVMREKKGTPTVDYSSLTEETVLVDNGNVLFSLNYNENDNASVRAAEALNEIVSAKSGRSLTKSNATIKTVAVVNTRSAYPSEFDALVERMGEYEYTVSTSDDIVFIAGDGDANLWIATNFFIKNLLGYDCENPTEITASAVLSVGSGVSYTAETKLSDRYDTVTLSGKSIREFSVVCPKEYENAGEALASYIELKSGIRPSITTNDDGGEYQIVFAKDEALAANQYRCTVSGAKITLSSANATTASLSAYAFIDKYVGFAGAGDVNAFATTNAQTELVAFDEKASFDTVDFMTDDYLSLLKNTITDYYSASVDTAELKDFLALDNGIDYTNTEIYDYTASNKTYTLVVEASDGVSYQLKRKINASEGTDTTTVKIIADDGKLPCFADEGVKNIIKASFSQAKHGESERIVLNSLCEVCGCDKCGGTYDSYYKLVAELAESVPDVEITLLASKATATDAPDFKMPSNVSVDFFTTDACFAHALDDASCETNRPISQGLSAWLSACDNVHVYDFSNDYTYFPATFPDFAVLGRNAAFYKTSGVKQITYVFSPELASREFGPLREYLIANLLMKAGMTDAEYVAMFDKALDGIYGIGAENIGKYIDLFAYSVEGCFTAFTKPTELLPVKITVDANGNKQYDVALAAKLYRLINAPQYAYDALTKNNYSIATLVFYAYEDISDYYIVHALPQFSYWLYYGIDTYERADVARQIIAETAK